MSSASNLTQLLLVKALNESSDGIAIIDARQAGFPVIYVSKGFENMTGYTSAEVMGKNFRLFQGSDTNQSELVLLRSAMVKGEACIATLRNYRKDGTMYWNELSITPVYDDDGLLSHFISIQKDVSVKILLEQQLKTLTNTDPVSGINNRRHFDERFSNLLSIAKRIQCEVSVLLISLDYFKHFNERYGQSAGDECLQKVGRCIAKSFQRTSDCAARFSGEEFSVASFSSNLEGLDQHIQKLCELVGTLNIQHSDSPHGVVTITIGGIQHLPNRDTTQEKLIELANLKLLAAKRNGGNCVNILD